MRRDLYSIELIKYRREQDLGNAQAPQLEAVSPLAEKAVQHKEKGSQCKVGKSV